jgi:MFS family permease
MMSHRAARFFLLLSDNSWYLAEGMLLPLFAFYTHQVGGSIFDIGYIYASYLITLGVSIIFVGHYSDVYNKEWPMFIGWLLHALFTFSYLFVETKMQFALVQVGLGISDALSTPTWYALYSRFVKENTGFFWGLNDGLDNICTGLGILLGGFIYAYTRSFNTLFIFMGCIHLIGAVGAYQLIRKKV